MKRLLIFFVLFQLLLVTVDGFSQTRRLKIETQNFNEKIKKQSYPLPESEFENIINGFNEGSVSKISRYFSQQVYVSLRSGERGYYSSNQAFYLLDNFFRINEPINFQTTSRMIESSTPYLAGKLFCRFKGVIEVYQLYLSLNWNGYRWEINQISIN